MSEHWESAANTPFTLDDVNPEFVEPQTDSDDAEGMTPGVADLLGRSPKPAEAPTAARSDGKGPTMFERLTRGSTSESKSGSSPVRPRTTAARAVPRKKGQYVKPLTELYVMASMATMMINPAVSTSIALNAENCAKAMDELAWENDSVNRVLHALVETTVVGKVIMAHLPILLVIATQTRAFEGNATITNLADMMNNPENDKAAA